MWLKLYTKFNLYQIVLLWLRSTRKNNCSGHWRILLTWKFHWDFTPQWQSPLLPQSTVGLVFGPISHTNIFKLCLMTTAQREMKPCNCQLYRFWENNILVFSFLVQEIIYNYFHPSSIWNPWTPSPTSSELGFLSQCLFLQVLSDHSLASVTTNERAPCKLH